MLDSYISNYLTNTDLSFYQCGIEDCLPGKSYGPAVRDHFLIHYIFSGKGVLKEGDNTYGLCRGNGFLIYPYQVAYYRSDIEEPWSYAWVGFNGKMAYELLSKAKFSADNPIFTYDNDDFLKKCFYDILACKSLQNGREERMLGYLYVLLSKLLEERNQDDIYDRNEKTENYYMKKAIGYISNNYSRKISVTDLTQYLGISRTYLDLLFKRNLNTSPKEYITNLRVSKAVELMTYHSLSIGDVARSVGYEDQYHFSKVFKKVRGQSPKATRNNAIISKE